MGGRLVWFGVFRFGVGREKVLWRVLVHGVRIEWAGQADPAFIVFDRDVSVAVGADPAPVPYTGLSRGTGECC